ncbi:MAG: hypothetical protein KGZ89_06745 [Actinobacteria bacterium]|nr:hypothetical protein [Actinomycetota bacterium]
MNPLFDKINDWFEDLKEYAENSPKEFLKDMEYILDSSFFEEVYEKLDTVRSSLDDLREEVEAKMVPEFPVEKLHKLINLVEITNLKGKYVRQFAFQESLFLNEKNKIRPPVNTHQVGDVFQIEEVEALLGTTVLDKEAVLKLLEKL